MISWVNVSRQLLLPPNLISVARMFIGCFIPFLILSPSFFMRVLAVAAFTIGALTDYWDGVIARKYGMESGFGKIMDPFADKVLVLGSLAAFVSLGFFSIWWVVPIFFREIVITFCRFAWLYEGSAVGAEKLGKYKFGLQVVTLSVCFVGLLVMNTAVFPAFHTVIVFLVAASCLLTVFSGYTFLISNEEHLQTPGFAKFTSALGVGLLRPAPGTWGSLLGVLLILLAQANGWVYWGTFLFLFGCGWWAVSRLEDQDKDPSFVVVDEACGMFIAMAGHALNPLTLVAGFVLFRLFDIIKPYPLRRLEKLPGYWGIMVDDLGAGVYTWIVLFLFF